MNNIKKFDIVIGNPPYQANSESGGQKGTRTHIWDNFVDLSLQIVKDDGYLSLIHPAGWRRGGGKFSYIGDKLRQKQMLYLEIHDIQDGQKVFGATTGYDWYVLQNKAATGKTIVIDSVGVKSNIDIYKLKAIPNNQIDEIIKLIAFENEEKVGFIFDRSSYGHDKKWVKAIKDDKFKHPVVYSLPKNGMRLNYSSTNLNGHFCIPKIIWSNGAATQILIDEKGEYGMTEWAYAIADEPNNLPSIKKAMESKKFMKLCEGMRFTLDKYDPKFISLLRKDFYKEFVNE
jgi:hypothetical protein